MKIKLSNMYLFFLLVMLFNIKLFGAESITLEPYYEERQKGWLSKREWMKICDNECRGRFIENKLRETFKKIENNKKGLHYYLKKDSVYCIEIEELNNILRQLIGKPTPYEILVGDRGLQGIYGPVVQGFFTDILNKIEEFQNEITAKKRISVQELAKTYSFFLRNNFSQ